MLMGLQGGGNASVSVAVGATAGFAEWGTLRERARLYQKSPAKTKLGTKASTVIHDLARRRFDDEDEIEHVLEIALRLRLAQLGIEYRAVYLILLLAERKKQERKREEAVVLLLLH